MPEKPSCKIAIGSAYQRPLRTNFTAEETFIQRALIDKPPTLKPALAFVAVYTLIVSVIIFLWIAL